MLLDTLTVKLIGDGSSLQSSLNSAAGSLSGFQGAVQKSGSALSSWGSSMMSGIGGTFKAAGAVAVGAVGAAVAASTSTIMGELDAGIARADIINNYPKMMANLGVANEDSAASIDRIKEGLDGLPTTTDAAASAVARFTSKNKDIGTSTDYFLALNNAILAGGAPTQIQENALEQLSQAYSKGTIDVMEWRALQTAMPGQLSQVAQAFGMTEDSLYSSLKSGETTMDDFMGKIVELNETGTGEFLSFSEQAKNATGGFQTQMANMRTAIARGWEGALNAFGSDRFAMVIGVIRQGISGLFEFITPAFARIGDAVESLFGEGGAFAQGTGSVTTSLGQISGPIGSIVSAFESAGMSMTGVFANLAPVIGLAAGAFGGLLGNIPLIGGAFAGLNPIFGATIGVFAGMIANSESLRNALSSAGSGIMEAFAPVATQIGPLLQGIVSTIGIVLGALGDAMAPIVTAIGGVIAGLAPVFGQLVNLVTTSFLPMIEQISQVAAPIGELIGSVVTAIGGALTPVLSAVISAVESLMPAIQTVISVIVDSVIPAALGVWNAVSPIIGIIGELVGTIISALTPVINTLIEIFGRVVAALTPWYEALQRIVTAIMPVAQAVAGILGVAFTIAGDIIGNVLNFVMPLIEGALGIVIGVADGIATAVEWVSGVVGPILETIGGWFSDTFGNAADDTEEAMGRIESSVGSAGDAVASNTDSSLSNVESSWDNVLGSVESNTESFSSSQTQNFDTLFNDLSASADGGMGNINSTLSGGFVDVEGVVVDAGSNADGSWSGSMSSLDSSTATGVGNVRDAVGQLPSAIQNSFSGAGSMLVSAGANIMLGLLTGINSQRGALMSTMTSIANQLRATAQAALDIQSPSRVFYTIGRYTIMGFINGVRSLSADATKVMNEIFATIAEQGRQSLDKSLEANDRQLNAELTKITQLRTKIQGVLNEINRLEESRNWEIAQLWWMDEKTKNKREGEINKWYDDQVSRQEKHLSDLESQEQTFNDRALSRVERMMEDMERVNQGIADSLSSALQGDYEAVMETLDELYTIMGDKGTKAARAMGNELYSFTVRLNHVNSSLEEARKNLEDSQKAMSDYASSVSGNLASQTRKVGDYTSAQDYLSQLQGRLANAKKFSSKIKELAAIGMPQVIIDEILGMGIDDGLAAAEALLTGMDSKTVASIINTHKEIDKIGDSLGSSLSKNYYQAGVDAAKGIVSGLESQVKIIEKTMQKLSNAMVKSIKKALGIKSPSRVFIDIMGQVMAGAVVGISDGTQALIDTMQTAIGEMVDVAESNAPELDVGVRPDVMDWMSSTRTIPENDSRVGLDHEENPYTINITVNTDSSDPEEIARAVERTIVRSLYT